MSRHDRKLQKVDDERRRMRKGMAREALQGLRVRPSQDMHRQPLSFAIRMAKGHSERTLEKWQRGGTKTTVVM